MSLEALSLGGGERTGDVVEALQKTATQGDRVGVGDSPRFLFRLSSRLGRSSCEVLKTFPERCVRELLEARGPFLAQAFDFLGELAVPSTVIVACIQNEDSTSSDISPPESL
jgi:hypothetical protein